MHMMQKLFKKKNPKTKPLRMSGVQKRFFVSYAVIVFAMMWCTTPVLAAGDPLAVVNNLSDFIFSLIRAIGLILLGFGVVQIRHCAVLPVCKWKQQGGEMLLGK